MDSINTNFTLQGYKLLYFTIINWYTCIVLMLCRVVEVRVSLNGMDYVPNSVFIRIDDCTVSCVCTHAYVCTHTYTQTHALTHTHTHTHTHTIQCKYNTIIIISSLLCITVSVYDKLVMHNTYNIVSVVSHGQLLFYNNIIVIVYAYSERR